MDTECVRNGGGKIDYRHPCGFGEAGSVIAGSGVPRYFSSGVEITMMRHILLVLFMVFVCAAFLVPCIALAETMGTEWDFNSGDYTPTFGSNVMSEWGTMATNRLFGTSTGFGGPEVPGTTGKNVWVTYGGMRTTDGLAISTGAANGGGAKVNQYTLVMDVMTVGGAQYRSIYNTNPDNANDCDFARYPNGSIGYQTTGGTMLQDPLTWYRVAVTVDAGANSVNHYIDGILVNTEPTDKVSLDGVYSAVANSHLLLFADDNVDLGSWFLSSAYYVESTLSGTEIAALGGPDGNGIFPVPEPSMSAMLFAGLIGLLASAWRKRG